MITEKSLRKLFCKRLFMCVFSMAVVALLLGGRAVQLNVLNKDFLQSQGNARYLRVVNVPAHRGMILDRNGEPLAISTPVKSVWADPQQLVSAQSQLPKLAAMLNMGYPALVKTLNEKRDKEFVYLRRHIPPVLEQQIRALKLPGIGFQREYRRYYPSREVTAQYLGLTDVDDNGQEGIELAFNDVLQGVSGSKRVIKDRMGQIVEDLESVKEPEPGKDVVLAMDRRVQYLAYREIKNAVIENQAESGSVVVLDVRTGELLAMTNYPSFNPNNRASIDSRYLRNRALTDAFEPGSTMKPFAVLAGLSAGVVNQDTLIDTTPGSFRLGSKRIRDHGNLGVINLRTLLQKSSNVGATKIALQTPPEKVWQTLHALGFGQAAIGSFPGEASGSLSDYSKWRDMDRAAHAYGYGMSASALQLARAYSVFGNAATIKPIALTKKSYLDPYEGSDPGIDKRYIEDVRDMLESVVEQGGTGTHARVKSYRVAGKTGTAEILSDQGEYRKDAHRALFSGVAPASDPRLAIVVMVDDPKGKSYFGGQVAAPAFAKIMEGALRMYNIAPDDLPLDSGERVAMLQAKQELQQTVQQ